ncbi:PQQ-binding-like beta-propeller repeat protein [Clostridium ganghwense]|uniref:PQQ-binding-like beta-propeller repeat protein n=1 Tax=Clostridium ganghwense TaxID=312089 RepID=A0ABT4CQK4_9CLOT|nr:PQQ-binding-like beta-propeller repeat protein [Clostridium ganghwense]MCY6371327.1 PQQ-binding-like beta-propeller repeat protein [Clostridium ganghwense]
MKKNVFNITALVLINMLLVAGCTSNNMKKVSKIPNGKVIKKKEVSCAANIDKTNVKKIDNNPIYVRSSKLQNIDYCLFLDNKKIKEVKSNNFKIFPRKYSDIDGILTFRGNNLRNTAAFGTAQIDKKNLKVIWSFQTSSGTWGGGAGWTGQASIIKWTEDTKKIMNLKQEFKNKKEFVEVVYASLDGNIYFIDLETGKKTRNPISIHNPIKGSVALDPRGYPLLYVGQGIPEKGEIGYRIFSLIDGKELYFIKGKDSQAFRSWGAFDGSPLINREDDTMILGGENGLLYNIKLNTKFDKENKKISIKPEVLKYRYKIKGDSHQGIENSVAVYKNLAYFADNGGGIQCVNLQTMRPVWTFDGKDDTDSTITIEEDDNIPYIYTANEVDKQGAKGITYLKKINGITGKEIFEKQYHAMSLLGDKPVNGGALATNVIGKGDIKKQVIFTIARYKQFNSGLMVALDKKTGEEIWKYEMPNYAWSSPVDIYDRNGKGYLIQGDSTGDLSLIEGKTGKVLNSINLGTNIESSPAVYNNILVVATRWGKIYGVKIE